MALVNSAEIKAEYDDLKARKGFRVVEHTIDSDNAAPRVCAQFSEDLVKQGVDYAQFVTVDDAAPKAVERRRQARSASRAWSTASTITSPSAKACRQRSARCWNRPSLLDIYIQDRAPSARFTGDSFVLPATARHGIPVVTVNLERRRHEAVPHRRPFAGAASVRLPVPAPARRL